MSIMSDIWIERQCTPTEDLIQEVRDSFGQPVSNTLMRAMQNQLLLITEERRNWKGPMIEPFVPDQVKTRLINEGTTDEREERILSYGLSSYGYDVRLANEFKIFTNIKSGTIDPHYFTDDHYVDHVGEYVIIPPNGFVLGRTIEYLRIPRDVLVVCMGKSTLARCGAIVNVTPLEPEWEGNVVIEISNTSNLPLKIHAGVGVAQFLFFKGDQPCRKSYADKGGKYQAQTGIVVAKV